MTFFFYVWTIKIDFFFCYFHLKRSTSSRRKKQADITVVNQSGVSLVC